MINMIPLLNCFHDQRLNFTEPAKHIGGIALRNATMIRLPKCAAYDLKLAKDALRFLPGANK